MSVGLFPPPRIFCLSTLGSGCLPGHAASLALLQLFFRVPPLPLQVLGSPFFWCYATFSSPGPPLSARLPSPIFPCRLRCIWSDAHYAGLGRALSVLSLYRSPCRLQLWLSHSLLPSFPFFNLGTLLFGLGHSALVFALSLLFLSDSVVRTATWRDCSAPDVVPALFCRLASSCWLRRRVLAGPGCRCFRAPLAPSYRSPAFFPRFVSAAPSLALPAVPFALLLRPSPSPNLRL